jgi:hypothetical protein
MKPLTKPPLNHSVNLPLLESVVIHLMELTLLMSLNALLLIQKPKVLFSLEKLVEKQKSKLLNGYLLTITETFQLSVLLLDKLLLQGEEWVTQVPSFPVEKVMLNLRLLAWKPMESLLSITLQRWEKLWQLS